MVLSAIYACAVAGVPLAPQARTATRTSLRGSARAPGSDRRGSEQAPQENRALSVVVGGQVPERQAADNSIAA